MGTDQPQHCVIVYTVLVSRIDMDYVILWATGHRETKPVLIQVMLNMKLNMDGLRRLDSRWFMMVLIPHQESYDNPSFKKLS